MPMIMTVAIAQNAIASFSLLGNPGPSHMRSTSFLNCCVPWQTALCDSDAVVREAAGEAFGILFRGGGGGMIETVVPGLLQSLDNAATMDKSLEGLRVILSVRPQTFSHVLPKLMAKPYSSSRCSWLRMPFVPANHLFARHPGIS